MKNKLGASPRRMERLVVLFLYLELSVGLDIPVFLR
jgi:hypothetical protein